MSTVVPFDRGRRRPTAPLAAAPLSRPRAEPLWREAVGSELRCERTRRSERIVDVARRAGVAPQYLSELERGRKDPSSEILSAVAGALQLRVADITGRAARRLATAVGPVCLAA